MKGTVRLILPTLLILSVWAPAAQEREAPPEPIELKHIMEWETIRSAAFSPDGQWFGYRIVPHEGNHRVVIKSTCETKEYRFPEDAEKKKSYVSFSFSNDSAWAVIVVAPDWQERQRLTTEQKPIRNDALVLNLDSGATREFTNIQSYSFPEEASTWLALRKYPPASGPGTDRADTPIGSDVLLWQVGTDNRLTIGKVSECAFNQSGAWFAWIVSSEDKESNSVQIRNMATGVVSPIDHGEFVYRRLTWNEQADGLAFLRGKEDDDYTEPLYSVIGLRDFDRKLPSKYVYDPNEDEAFPREMTVSPNRRAAWTDDLSAISFGIHEARLTEEARKKRDESQAEKDDGGEDAEDGDDEEGKEKERSQSRGTDREPARPDVVVWHWQDKRLQPRQQQEEGRDKNFSYLCLYHVDEKRFVQLATDKIREVRLTPQQKWGIGIDTEPYELMANLDGRQFNDIYVIDLKTGFYRLAVEKCRWEYGPSFEGTAFLYYRDRHFHVYDMDSRRSINITKNVDTSFVDETHGRNIVDPPIHPRSYGWVKGGQSVLLYDNWDVWQVFTDGSGGVNLTKNGKEQAIRYQRRFRLDPDEKGIDLSEPLYLQMYGEWSKKGGIAFIDPAEEEVLPLYWEDALFGDLIKAKNEAVYAFTRETYKKPPHYQLADERLKVSTQLTDDLSQMENVLWSKGSLLVDYVSRKGDRLQASLHLPAGYEQGKSYPTIVYIYERLSQRHHAYQNPGLGFSPSVYTSHGYAVLMPDIEYHLNDPGMSAVWCLIPAVEAALETGVVDQNRIGLHGHSWGGYQTAFVITQTNLFRAAIAGAPLTNMISMYSSVYWSVGYANQPIFESAQGRFKGPYTDYWDAYQRNSPVYHAHNVNTPLLLLHNDADGAVDWNQGIEYYNTLRRLRKPVVMLQYKGERHGLTRMENRKDYFLRMKEFWDHHLKGDQAPDWWSAGVLHLDLAEHIDERMQLMKYRNDLNTLEIEHE